MALELIVCIPSLIMTRGGRGWTEGRYEGWGNAAGAEVDVTTGGGWGWSGGCFRYFCNRLINYLGLQIRECI